MTETAYSDPTELPVVRIFLSSPGDVQSERTVATEIVEGELARRSAFLEPAVLRVVRYDDPQRQIPLVQGMSMREAVNIGPPSLLRTTLLLTAQGWTRQGDADFLRGDRVFRLAVSAQQGAGAADVPLASQSTLSRLAGMRAPAWRDPAVSSGVASRSGCA